MLLSKIKNSIKLTILLLSFQILTSCAGKLIEGGMLSGVRAKQYLNSNTSIIFGKIEVYDKSNNLTPYEDMNISDFCTMFINDDPLYGSSLLYKYNRPESGQTSNIYKGLFAIQVSEEDFQDGKELNLACGTRQSLERVTSFMSGLSLIEPRSYLKMDLKRQVNLSSFEGKAIYLGDMIVSIPKNAAITKEDMNFKTRLTIITIGGSQSRDAMQNKIDSSSVVKNNFKEASKDLIDLFPYIQKDFSLKKATVD